MGEEIGKNTEKFFISDYPEGYNRVKEEILSDLETEEEKDNFMNVIINFMMRA